MAKGGIASSGRGGGLGIARGASRSFGGGPERMGAPVSSKLIGNRFGSPYVYKATPPSSPSSEASFRSIRVFTVSKASPQTPKAEVPQAFYNAFQDKPKSQIVEAKITNTFGVKLEAPKVSTLSAEARVRALDLQANRILIATSEISKKTEVTPQPKVKSLVEEAEAKAYKAKKISRGEAVRGAERLRVRHLRWIYESIEGAKVFTRTDQNEVLERKRRKDAESQRRHRLGYAEAAQLDAATQVATKSSPQSPSNKLKPRFRMALQGLEELRKTILRRRIIRRQTSRRAEQEKTNTVFLQTHTATNKARVGSVIESIKKKVGLVSPQEAVSLAAREFNPEAHRSPVLDKLNQKDKRDRSSANFALEVSRIREEWMDAIINKVYEASEAHQALDVAIELSEPQATKEQVMEVLGAGRANEPFMFEGEITERGVARFTRRVLEQINQVGEDEKTEVALEQASQEAAVPAAKVRSESIFAPEGHSNLPDSPLEIFRQRLELQAPLKLAA